MKNIRHIATAFLMIMMIFFSLSPAAFAEGSSPVTIESENLIVYPADRNTIGIVQIMKIKNNTNQAINKLKVYLPKGSQNIQVRSGLNKKKLKKTDKGVMDPTGMKPGEKKQVMVSYKMPMKKGQASWTIQQAYLTKKLYVVVQKGVFSFRASNLATQSNVFKMNGKQYRRFTRLDLHADMSWTVSFKLLAGTKQSQAQNQEGGTANSSNGGMNGNNSGDSEKFTADGKRILDHQHGGDFGIAIATLLLIVLAMTLGLMGLKRDGILIARKRHKPRRSWLVTEKNNLLEEMGQLEDDYQSKLISETTYRSTRQKLRDLLVRITLEVREE